ncbi:MAG TPA: riboflavin synthase [Syntrophales bacterium]|nr:riboflavin synthase [Syntrophales bacterium]HOL58740.1 riboflavin synthase [Syntrophales bacterium]HPO34972.1 riboflavin synthase [Syntrophales bacterium]
MFTGIIQFTGQVRRWDRSGRIARLEIETAGEIGDVKIGDSIAVNGVCLTVIGISSSVFQVEVSQETLLRSTIGELKMGEMVNLEKALRPMDFLGGHIVLGHVDAVGVIKEKTEKPGALIIGVEVPEEMVKYIVEKGSISVDGISLTVNYCQGRVFYVNIIPHTARVTTLGRKRPGERVNIEVDIIGKYVEKLIERKEKGIDEKFLAEHGFLR